MVRCADKRHDHGLKLKVYARQPGRGRVLEQVADERNGVWRGSWSEDLRERMGFDLGELVLHVLSVYQQNFLPRGRTNSRSGSWS